MRISLPTRPGQWSGNLALAALALGAFTIGTAELLVVGVLNLIARGMGVPVSTAGLLVTGYALGISPGGPVLTAATIRLGRRFLLWLALVLYIAGNVLAVMSVNMGMLIAARVLTGSVHGLFIGIAFAVAAGLVPPGPRDAVWRHFLRRPRCLPRGQLLRGHDAQRRCPTARCARWRQAPYCCGR